MSDAIPPGLRIRQAEQADLTVIAEYNRRLALETESKRLDPEVLASGVASALADPDRLRYYLAELGEASEIVAQAAISREWSDWRNGWVWWLQSVYVAERHRGRGVFKALFRHIRSLACSEPDVIGLRLYVENSNQPALQTYRALGLQPAEYSLYQELWLERRSRS